MKTRKVLCLALTLAMLCALLSGCVYINADTTIHDSGAGTIVFAAGLLAGEGEEPEEGQEVFQANGNTYYGNSATHDFASVDEFNKLFTPGADGAMEENDGVSCTLRKNSDGSLTLVFLILESEEEAEEKAEAENGEEVSPEEAAELQEMGELMAQTAYSRYIFNFDQPIRQLSGPTDAVTVEGKRLTIDPLKQAENETNRVYVFVTDVASTVVPTQQKLKVDGVVKETEIYNINGANYFKLRDMAALLNGTASQFSVNYDAATGTILIKTGEAYTPVEGDLTVPAAEKAAEKAAGAVKSAQSLMINGESAYLAPYNIGGNNYFALRDLGSALGFGVDYDSATGTMLVTSGK